MRRGGWALAGIVLCGAVLRIGYVLTQAGHEVQGDGEGYYHSALLLADGHGFVSSGEFLLTSDAAGAAAADHPPAWILVLAALAVVGFQRIVYFQLLAAVIGVATVAAVGVTGRRIAGPRVGLIAAGLAALYPNLWMYERVLLCETLAVLLATLVVYAAYAVWDRPSTRGAALLGLTVGLLTLTRPEALLLVGLLVVPAIALRRRAGGTEPTVPVPVPIRLRRLGVATAVAGGLIAPWAVYNSLRFEEPVILTSNLGQTMVASYCPESFYGPGTGWWSYACLDRATADVGYEVDASVRDAEMRTIALRYLSDQQTRLPAVLWARQGRTWGFHDALQQTRLDAVGGPSEGVTRAGLYAYWPLAGLAGVGMVVLRRRGRPLFPLVAPAATVVIATTLTFGQTRYRALAEATVVLLAAVAVGALVDRWRARHDAQEILRTQLTLRREPPTEAPTAAGDP